MYIYEPGIKVWYVANFFELHLHQIHWKSAIIDPQGTFVDSRLILLYGILGFDTILNAFFFVSLTFLRGHPILANIGVRQISKSEIRNARLPHRSLLQVAATSWIRTLLAQHHSVNNIRQSFKTKHVPMTRTMGINATQIIRKESAKAWRTSDRNGSGLYKITSGFFWG